MIKLNKKRLEKIVDNMESRGFNVILKKTRNSFDLSTSRDNEYRLGCITYREHSYIGLYSDDLDKTLSIFDKEVTVTKKCMEFIGMYLKGVIEIDKNNKEELEKKFYEKGFAILEGEK